MMTATKMGLWCNPLKMVSSSLIRRELISLATWKSECKQGEEEEEEQQQQKDRRSGSV